MLINLTVEEFLRKRKSGFDSKEDYQVGVYILHNQTKNKYYIGQSKDLLNRIFSHVNGRGNGDVYFDYKSGDEFRVRIYSYNPNQFRSLDEFEYHYIRIYEPHLSGYNRQAGNHKQKVTVGE